MNLTDVSAFDVARLAAAFGWGLVSALWSGITGAFGAAMVAYTRRHMPVIRITADDDDTPPGPPAAA